MKSLRITGIIISLIAVCIPARSADFWDLYSENLMYNYSVKTGTIPDTTQYGQRLDNDEVFSILTKSFSQALGERISKVAKQQKGATLICFFTDEPERCVVDNVLEATFDEVHFINAPGFSNRFLKKLRKYYSYTLAGDRRDMMERVSAADNVPRKKNFNPRFGINLSEPEIIVATPFYSFFGVYVEPKFGTRRGPSLSFMLDDVFFDFQKEGLSIKYNMSQRRFGKGYLSITVHPEGEIYISNELILK